MVNDLDIVKQKLKGFIRKYYNNQIVRGLLISVSILLVLLLIVDLVEYYSWSDSTIRTAIFYSYLAVTGYVLVRYVFIPLIKLLQLGPTISNEEAARIIGQHFPEVDDKLINTLQLEEKLKREHDRKELDLLLAGVRQKAAVLKPVPFKKAVNFRANMKYLKYLVPPVLIILTILLIAPAFITEPSARIIRHQTDFEKPLPYKIILLNDSLTVLQHDDFTVNIRVDGEEIPARIKLSDGSFSYRISETKPGVYAYTFRDVESDIYFTINTEEYESPEYHLTVRPKPVIYNINVALHYPNYLGKKDDVIENAGDLVVPEGTRLIWNIYTKDTRRIVFKTNEEQHLLESPDGNVFTYKQKALNEFRYTIYGQNNFVRYSDSLNFFVELIKDEYPVIKLEKYTDENILGFTHFNGYISDDHGFHSLYLFYQKDQAVGDKWLKKELKIDPELSRQFIQYTIRANDFGLSPGENMSYYFEVRDNDAVHGFKATKTKTFALTFPTEEELAENVKEKSDDLKKDLEEAKKNIADLSVQMEKIRNSLYEKKELNWMDKQELDLMLQKEESLMDKINQLKELNEQMKELEQLIKQEMDPELAKKMKELEKMFNDLMNEEMKKELEKMKKELENMDKDKVNDFLEQMKKNNEELLNNLDQNLELFKQMEFEKKANEAIKKLEELAKEQKKLAEKTGQKELSKEDALKEQEKINDAFKKIEEELKDADELNKELEEPLDFQMDSTASQQIQEDLDEASSKLDKGKQKKASENQQSAGDKMEKMASDLSMMMESAMMSQMGEDADQVKKMLDNLLDLSFEEEKMIRDFNEVSPNDPRYIDFAEKQKLIEEDYMIVHDSLIAISKRQIFIQPFIIKESGKVISHINNSLISMQERRKGQTLNDQQYAMTSMNNLALMLEESLNQMQQSMSMMSGKPGKGKCNRPGGKGNKPSLSELLQMQQQLNQGMGKKGKKSGSEGQNGMTSEQLARMAAMQAEIRRQLQDYIDQLEAEGGNGSSLNKITKEMEKTEEDIINKRITEETLKRQKDLEVRLLKAKNAKLKQDRENKRESREGKNIKRGNQIEQLQYKDNVITQEELLRYAPIEMSPYYKELLKKYLYKLERENGSQ